MKPKVYNIIKWVFFPFFLPWCFLQNLIGFTIWVYLKFVKEGKRKKNKEGIVYFSTSHFGGCSLGYFIFLNGDNEIDIHHEYGHELQSLLLGPLYLLLVGLPSGITCLFNLTNNNNYKYYLLPWECWADKWGGVMHKNLSYNRSLS